MDKLSTRLSGAVFEDELNAIGGPSAAHKVYVYIFIPLTSQNYEPIMEKLWKTRILQSSANRLTRQSTYSSGREEF